MININYLKNENVSSTRSSNDMQARVFPTTPGVVDDGSSTRRVRNIFFDNWNNSIKGLPFSVFTPLDQFNKTFICLYALVDCASYSLSFQWILMTSHSTLYSVLCGIRHWKFRGWRFKSPSSLNIFFYQNGSIFVECEHFYLYYLFDQ